MNPLQGRTALVTGGSRGIGRAVALELGRLGARVVISYRRDREAAESVVAELQAMDTDAAAFPADVAVADEARALVAEATATWGRLDILVNNAGITRDKSLRKLSAEDWNAVMATNLSSVFYTVSAARETMCEQRHGRIVNIGSFVGQAGNFGQTNYAASKGGMIAFTKSAALELARYNVTVNIVAPGFTLTEMLDQVPDEIREKLIEKIPAGRFGRPEEVARAVAFLATDGDYITGQQLNVNGGIYM